MKRLLPVLLLALGCSSPVVETPADAGCDRPCGTTCCSEGKTCQKGVCTLPCKPQCQDRECGPDECGGTCGECQGTDTCDESAGYCRACQRNCQSRNCGADGCGGSCGTCASGQLCSAGSCVACTPKTCAQLQKTCGDVADGCGGTLQCGTCAAPLVCGGGGVPNVCACPRTTCQAAGKNCGFIPDGCGGQLDCGTCPTGETCGTGGVNVCGVGPCPPESDQAFCVRLGKNCGQTVGFDNCGTSRTTTCGVCTSPQTCGGSGTPNVCACPETNAAFCQRLGLSCGTGTATDVCGSPRVVDCGACTAPATCGGAGTPGACGCTPESSAALCARLGKNCGTVSAPDNCLAQRSVECGACSAGTTCGGAGVANVCGAPQAPDSDCDGLSNEAESIAGTNPNLADTDADGLPDGVELGSTYNPDPQHCPTSPLDADPATRTDPLRPDSDCDGRRDGEEDADHDGRVGPGETNPALRDTDGDGLADGTESGVTVNPDPQHCPGFVPDADPATRTDPLKADTDGDSVPDGTEDADLDGRWDAGELNPLDPADGSPLVQQTCGPAGLRPTTVLLSTAADLALGVGPDFSEVVRPQVGGTERAIMVYSATQQVVGLAVSLTPAGATVAAEATAVLTRIGSLSFETSQPFTTWDGYPAVHEQAVFTATGDLKQRANQVLNALLQGTATNTLTGNAGVVGPFALTLDVVKRPGRTVVAASLTPVSLYLPRRPFVLTDLAGGSALAQAGDAATTRCEPFRTAARAKVDLLWVVDNSGSMQAAQVAIANAGQTLALQNTNLDWRMAATTTSFYDSPTSQPNRVRPFTTDAATINSWFAADGADRFGISGTGYERPLQSAQLAIQSLLPATTGNSAKLRPDATLVVVILGDADDQSPAPVSEFTAFFSNYDGAGHRAQVHAITCPEGKQCSQEEDPIQNGRTLNVVQALGGVFGDIRPAVAGGSVDPMLAAILDAVDGATSPYRLSHAAIGPSLRVGLEPSALAPNSTCPAGNVPRDRTNGYDFVGLTQKLVFFGTCRPVNPGRNAVVSYSGWDKLTP